MAARYRLGMPVFSDAGPCPACHRLSDVLGVHAMSCGWGGERISSRGRTAGLQTSSSPSGRAASTRPSM